MAKSSLIGMLFWFAIGFPLSAQTYIEAGEVSGIWTAEHSPYRILGNINIPEDSLLQVAKGVVVEFQGNYQFEILGTLKAEGQAGDSIYFIPKDEESYGWGGIRISGPDQDSSVLSHCVIENCTITNYNSQIDNAALSILDGARVLLSNSAMRNNIGGYQGGALTCQNAYAVISYCTFENNFSRDAGGAIFSRNCQLQLLNNKFLDNRADRGGAIYGQVNEMIQIDRNQIYGNFANNDGGAIALINDTSALISSNILSYNETLGGGGALYFNRCDSIWILNNLISKNTVLSGSSYSDGGGGIYSFLSQLNLINNTIADNTEVGLFSNSSDICLVNNILSENGYLGGLPEVANIYFYDRNGASSMTIKNCLLKGGTNTINIQSGPTPVFTGPIYDGDPLFTDPDRNLYELDFGSPAINSGSDTTTNLLPSVDLIGVSRIVDDTVEIGAYEFNHVVRNRKPKIAPVSDYFINPGDTIGIQIQFTDPDLSDEHKIRVYSDNPDFVPGSLDAQVSGSSFLMIPLTVKEDTTGVWICVEDGSMEENSSDSIRFQIIRSDNVAWQAGSILKDMVWAADTVRIFGNLKVEENCSLTIKAGTYIEFQGNYKLDCKGQVLASGAAGDSITFTANPALPNPAWQGIWYNLNSSEGDIPPEKTSVFDHCIVEKATIGFWLENLRDIKISHCAVRGNKQGIRSEGGSTITYCSIYDNVGGSEGGGMYLSGTGRNGGLINKVYHNKIFQNSTSEAGGGLYLDGSYNIILGNQIYRNYAEQGGGISLDKWTTHTDVINNTVVMNQAVTGGGIWLAGDVRVINNIFQYNRATEKGQQIWIYPSYPGTGIKLHNCLLEGGMNMVTDPGFTFGGDQVNILNEYSSFTDSSSNDFSLVPNSYCINAGILDTFLMDRLGQDVIGELTIPDGSADIGAVEFQGLPENRLPLLAQSEDLYIRPDTSSVVKISYREFDTNDTTIIRLTYDETVLQIDSSYVEDGSVSLHFSPISDEYRKTSVFLELLDHSGISGRENSDTLRVNICNTQHVCGEIEEHTTWDLDTVIVNCNVVVASNARLEIRPGTIVRFAENTGLSIYGILKAQGTEEEPIRFEPLSQNWKGISLNTLSDLSSLKGDTSVMMHCIFEKTNISGLTIGRSEFILKNSVISNHQNGAVSISGEFAPVISGNSFLNNKRYCINNPCLAHVKDNLFSGNHGGREGMIQNSRGFPVIEGNNFIDNYGNVIVIYQNYSFQHGFNILNNRFTGTRPDDGAGGSAIVVYNHRWGYKPGLIVGNYIYDNHAIEEGGGIHIEFTEYDRIHLVNNTIVGNRSELLGGGLLIGKSARVNMTNNILWGNTVNDKPDQICFGYLNRGGNFQKNVIQGGIEGFSGWESSIAAVQISDWYSDDPGFANPVAQDYRLTKSSPYVNAGILPDTILNLPEFDLSGAPRILEDTVDLGAFEFICQDGYSDTTFSICEGEELWIGADIYTQPGEYTGLTKTILGCDSIVKFILEVRPGTSVSIGEDTSIYINESIVFDAGPGHSAIQWIDGSSSRELHFSSSLSGYYLVAVTVQNEAGCTASDTLYLEVLKSTSSEEDKKNKAEFTVFPNPVNDRVYLTIEGIYTDIELTLVSSSGQTILKEDIRKGASGTIELETGHLPPGPYYLRINTEGMLIKEEVLIKQ